LLVKKFDKKGPVDAVVEAVVTRLLPKHPLAADGDGDDHESARLKRRIRPQEFLIDAVHLER
jgi:hypothetical protein